MDHTTDLSFDPALFHFDGMYLVYGDSQYGGAFVARFKYIKRNRVSFQRFLARNFTPAEYFARLDAGESPLGILQSRGYVSPSVARARRAAAAAA